MGDRKRVGKERSVTIQLRDRDFKLLKRINRFGFVDVLYLSKAFHLHPSSIYRRCLQLVHARYLHYRCLFHRERGVYWLTRRGVDLIQDPLPPIKAISSATFRHQVAVLHASIALTQLFGGSFMTERELRHDSSRSGVGVQGHVCDGVLIQTDKRIAIEVELTQKSTARLTNILQEYCLQSDYQEVWYLCGHERLYQRFLTLKNTYPFLRVFLLSDLLAEVPNE